MYATDNAVYTASQAWATTTAGDALDMLGNWRVLVTDKDGDGPDGNATPGPADNTERRTHNMANELATQDMDGGGNPVLSHTYDKAGNLRTQQVGSEASPTTVTYTHDLWNRLVKATYASDVRGEYVYNALNWRIMKRADTNPETSIGLDEERRMYYSASWQMLEERIDVESPFSGGSDLDKYIQYVWGQRYIDDIVMRRLDANKDGDFIDTSLGDRIYYHCTDVQFSTVAVMSDVAALVERVSYDAYGKARHHYPADWTGDGSVGSNDLSVVLANWGSLPAPGDFDRDGDVDAGDLAEVNAESGSGIAFGKLSITDNVIGWDGYVFNAELQAYTVRFRWYEPEGGRWWERDLAGYIHTMNLFCYVDSMPTVMTDAMGLGPTDEEAGDKEEFKKALEQYLNDPSNALQAGCPTNQVYFAAEWMQQRDFTLNGVRYIYTQKCGWVDLLHFFAAAREAIDGCEMLGGGELIANFLGWFNEVGQELQGDPSGSPLGENEDLRSNALGADFGDEYLDDCTPLEDQIIKYLESECGAILPPPPAVSPPNNSPGRSTNSQSADSPMRESNSESQQGTSDPPSGSCDSQCNSGCCPS